MARVGIPVCVAVLLAGGPVGAVAPKQAVHVQLWADRDDDDADGRADGEEERLPPQAFADLVPLDARLIGVELRAVSGGEHARIIGSGGVPVPWGRAVSAPAWFQGVSPGRVELVARSAGAAVTWVLDVSGLDMVDGDGNTVDMAKSHASIERLPPAPLEEGVVDAHYDDFDALRVTLSTPTEVGDESDPPPVVTVESVNAAGVKIDALPLVRLASFTCRPPMPSMRCWASVPLKFVIDDVDRNFPLVADRSLKAEVGGAIVIRVRDHKAQAIRVLGPRMSPAGPIGRFRASLRAFVLRVAPGGSPSIGGTDAGALNVLRSELASASAIWGQCGVSFGEVRSFDVRVVDPPPSHLVALGDELGMPAGGGEIHLRVDGKPLTVATTAGETPGEAAYALARSAERAGFVGIVSPNARIGAAAYASVDISIRHKDGTLAVAELPTDGPLSTDPTLAVRIGSVDLSDGLMHFTDMDAVAGTLEERTLLKSIDNGEPNAIEVVVVPLFAGGGRIGESFIGSDLSSVRNVVVLDRAGIRARKSSLTLAHELGHVLMDMPGHPDDYGDDMSTSLMDSDAADASPFGPRRLGLAECARVVRQSGPRARVPLLADWPVAPIVYDAKR